MRADRLIRTARRTALAVLVAAATAGGAALSAQTGVGAPALEISIAPQALGPGDAALVTVISSRPLTALEGRAFDGPVAFWQAGDAGAGRWQALMAVPLDTEAGASTLTLDATAADGATVTSQAPFPVVARTFATRRLKVAAGYADPPASSVDRILREAATLADLFAQRHPGRLWRGAFTAPVPGKATSSFGRLTMLNGKPGSRHQGADFRAASGVPLHAPNAGIVALAEDLYFSGNTVVLDHGEGLYSLFAHLSRIDVEPGTEVTRGARLGNVGATGRVTGPHLHWAVRLGNTSVDPLSLMAAVAKLDDETPVR